MKRCCVAAVVVAVFVFETVCGETRTVNNVDELYEALAELSNKSSVN